MKGREKGKDRAKEADLESEEGREDKVEGKE